MDCFENHLIGRGGIEKETNRWFAQSLWVQEPRNTRWNHEAGSNCAKGGAFSPRAYLILPTVCLGYFVCRWWRRAEMSNVSQSQVPSSPQNSYRCKMHLRTGQVPISGVISGKQLYTCLQVSRNHCHITLTYRLQVFKRISLNLAGLFITENQSYLTRALTKKLNNRPCQRKVYFCCQPLVFSLLVPDFSYWHLKCP